MFTIDNYFPLAKIAVKFLVYYLALRAAGWLYKSLFSKSRFNAIPGPLPESWFKGNLGQLFNAKGLPFHQGLVDKFGGMVKVYGFFGDEQLYISDPRALQSIIMKDQDAFEETSVFIETNKAIFGPGLVATTGDHHKRQRKIVSPVFAVGQLRRLTPVFYEIADKLADVLAKEVHGSKSTTDPSGVIDMSEWMSRVALESVGRAVLGYSFDPLDSAYNNPYTSAIKELIPTIFSLSIVRQFAPFLATLGPPSFRRKLVEWTPNQAIQKVKNMSDVMHEAAQSILRQKRATIAQEGGFTDSSTKDIISVLLQANDRARDGERLSESELTGQMTVLIFGAQDTTSAALSRILYLLSIHPGIQATVREEIRTALRDRRDDGGEAPGRLAYEDVLALPWLDAVVRETMRLYPPVPFVRRTAVKERTIPFSNHHDSTLSTVTIPVGTTIFVGIAGSNRLESVWGPDAKEWKPQRWLSGKATGELPDGVDDTMARLPGVYSGMMTFLGGGRSCIGYKFAQAEMKILLITLLSKFTFTSTGDDIVWNLSQIISPSVRTPVSNGTGTMVEEKKGLPLVVRINE